MRTRWTLTALAGLLCIAAWGGVVLSEDTELEEVRQAAKPIDHRPWGVGRLVADLAFEDIDGEKGKLSDYRGKVLVVAVTNVGCPICRRYAPTLVELHEKFAERGVEFILLNPMEHETVAQMRDAIERYGFQARYVHDPEGHFARALKIDTTGDSFVLDASRTLRYRGAVDDQYGFGYALPAPRVNYLRDALEAVIAGGDVTVPATWAPGCEIDVLEAAPVTEPEGDENAEPRVTWHNRVSRIIADNCQQCHREGENGPFELMTYADVRGNRAMIRRQVSQRLMPPWFANPEYGDFKNDHSLSDADREDLLAWIADGLPEGDEADAPQPRKWTAGWLIGEPEIVFELPRTERIPARGTVPYRHQIVTTEFEEDRWVQAMEIRPTSPQVVHHVLVFLEYPREHPRADEQPQDRGGLHGYFMGMVPGQGHIVFPEGQGKFLPKGARMHFQLHYTPNGEATTDRTRLAMIFTNERPQVEVQTRGVSNFLFAIPPGADNHEVVAEYTLRRPKRLLSLMPHMHVRGKAYRYEVEYPDGRRETLLDIPRYDFNWQLLYELREPIDLPRGAKIIATGWFDNSDKNPANPDPSKTVRFGEQTWDEMQIGYVNWYVLD